MSGRRTLDEEIDRKIFGRSKSLWHYSEDIADAWRLVTTLTQAGTLFSLHSVWDEADGARIQWQASLTDLRTNKKAFAIAETMPLAICEMALKWVG